jgi:hypothetical protein
MEQLCKILKPLANLYIILLIWSLTILNFYLCFKPMMDYATAAGLKTIPTVLDGMNYYTPDEGYQALSSLGDNGRNAYRLVNYADFVLPLLLFLSLSLPNVALGKRCHYVIGPLIYMISDYIENIFEKYVLEIYPKRNDLIMTLACYAGLVKIVSFAVCLLLLIINGLKWVLKSKDPSQSKSQKTQKLK